MPMSYSKGGGSETISYLPGAWQISTPGSAASGRDSSAVCTLLVYVGMWEALRAGIEGSKCDPQEG